MMKHKRAISLLLAIASLLCFAVGTFAFFTDRIESGATAKAGTLDLVLSDITKSTAADYKLKPGDGVKIDFILSNEGNKSADVREILVLNCPGIAMTAAAPEFELYHSSDVTLTGNLATIKSGAAPVAVRALAADNKKITYTIDEFVLNGSGTGAETEPEAVGTSKSSSYVMVFRASADNDFANKAVTLYYEAQAKQHRNTGPDTWTTVQSETVNFAGVDGHKAVPVKQ